MASTSQSSDGIIAGINVTPMVDITLVLLIIFIVTAKIIVTPAVPLDLPRASQSEEIQVVFSVIVPANGPILVNGEPATTDEALLEVAGRAVGQDHKVRAVINADGAVPHRSIIHKLELVKTDGIAKIAFGAPTPDEGNR